MFPLLVCVKLLWNLKWKALLKLCKWLGVGLTAVLALSTVATRRYCHGDSRSAGADPASAVGNLKGMRYWEAAAKMTQNSTSADVKLQILEVPSALQEVGFEPLSRHTEGTAEATKNISNSGPTWAPVKVLLLTYPDGSSSFLNDLFRNDDNAFHIVEAASPIYTYAYGNGLDVANFHPNDTFRSPPLFESNLQGAALFHMLNCHLDRLPTEFFSHPSTIQKVNSYQSCRASRSTIILDKCLSFLPEACKKHNYLEWCHREIEKVIDCFKVRDCSRYDGFPAFFQHRLCLEEIYRTQVLPCLPQVQSACDRASMRVASTNRLSMDAVTPLIYADPSIKIIHLVQDPRWTLSSSRTRGLSKTPAQLCFSIFRDIQIRENLESSFRGSFLQVKLEDFLQETARTTKALYHFLGLPLSEKVTNLASRAKEAHPRLQGLVKSRRGNTTHTSFPWQNTVATRDRAIINKACRELLTHLQYKI